MEKGTALVCGAGGFIGSHLAKRLQEEGWWVRGVDLKYPEYLPFTEVASEFVICDLRNPESCKRVLNLPFDRVYQLAADMGGAGFCFTGDNDADIMHNSALINLNIVHLAAEVGVKKIFYSSSACVYPKQLQNGEQVPRLTEDVAYPADPDCEYGWEKLFSERLYFSYKRNKSLDVRVARFHNIFGPEGTFTGGREKVPAAVCRTIAETTTGQITVWGSGKQMRSFLYIDDCLDAIEQLMQSETFCGPVNIGSEEVVTINELVRIVADIAKKDISIVNTPGPLGVSKRNSDNTLIQKELGWEPKISLRQGLEKTYKWIEKQVSRV